MMLAAGYRKPEVAKEIGVDRGTIYDWLAHPDFYCEVDRLTFMVDVAVRAERIRKSMRLLRAREVDGVLQSDKDSLDWMKFVQSETDGAKVDLSKLSDLFYQTEDGPRSNLPDKIADIEAGYNRGLLLAMEPEAAIDVDHDNEQPQSSAAPTPTSE